MFYTEMFCFQVTSVKLGRARSKSVAVPIKTIQTNIESKQY